MKKNHSDILHKHAAFQTNAGMFLLFSILFFGFPASGQSYFYFENKIAQPDGNNITLYSFLIVNPEGSDTVRTISSQNPSTEQALADSVFTHSSPGDLKYLVPAGDAVVKNSDTSFAYKLRYIFKRQVDSSSIYYIPFKTEYSDIDGKWKEAETVKIQQKTKADLIHQKDLVRLFYSEDDPFYVNLLKNDLRAVNVPRKEKMFLLVVANTDDDKIGATSKKDFETVNNNFTTLAANLGMKLIAIPIMGKDFNRKNVEKAFADLKKAKPSSTDIILFYYSGHGFRYSNDVSLYPRMLFTPKSLVDTADINKNSLALEDVYKYIIKLGARVNIVLADCCNDNIGEKIPVGGDIMILRGGDYNKTSQFLNLYNVIALFFPKITTSIIASSTQPYQLALGNPNLGGFFTYYFNAVLEKSLYSYEKSSSWIGILAAAKEKARLQALTGVCGPSSSDRCVQLTQMRVDPPM